ncbi:prostaglandin E2 receptor EP3 subtype-like [Protopterus annectens]|uniref:prostaglandin E2 receptor EP3 subtype-like n=1 Tax=Protopterus annectens TaxID=7888 RepID=UPI001CFC2B29|nr:prostaglandin E2 receptor EP3 subtype-like [Protopterus annectens]
MWLPRLSGMGQENGNLTEDGKCRSMSVALPVTMMVSGMIGNALALLLAYKSYHRKDNKRKCSFLIFIGSLALTDMTGQLLTSPIVISVYLSDRNWDLVDPSRHLCAFFGLCMTIFGLCPLFLANAMAVERTLAILAPHWYSNHMTARLTKSVVLFIWGCVILFAMLPIVGAGKYTLQWPCTWCFISTGDGLLSGNTIFALTFAGLGTCSLIVTFGCNLATIKGLVTRCKTRTSVSQTSRQWERITVETMIQLMGIMCVLFACWSPLLVLLLKQYMSYKTT